MRPPLPLVIYSAALTVVALGGAHFFSSRPRFLMPAFPLLFVAARWVCRARPCVRLPLVAGCAGLSTVYGVHLLTASSVAP